MAHPIPWTVAKQKGSGDVYFGATYDFCSERSIEEIQSAWNASGPYDWRAFENDQYGVYIVARVPEKNLRIRLLGTPPNYSLEIDGDVPVGETQAAKSSVLSLMLERLLPSIGSSGIRDTSNETGVRSSARNPK